MNYILEPIIILFDHEFIQNLTVSALPKTELYGRGEKHWHNIAKPIKTPAKAVSIILARNKICGIDTTPSLI